MRWPPRAGKRHTPARVHHDRGSQYTSGRYRDRLFAEGIIPLVGHTGICYDNAAAESFNATIKKELIYEHVWRDAGEVRTAVLTTSSDITITSGNNVGSAR